MMMWIALGEGLDLHDAGVVLRAVLRHGTSTPRVDVVAGEVVRAGLCRLAARWTRGFRPVGDAGRLRGGGAWAPPHGKRGRAPGPRERRRFRHAHEDSDVRRDERERPEGMGARAERAPPWCAHAAPASRSPSLAAVAPAPRPHRAPRRRVTPTIPTAQRRPRHRSIRRCSAPRSASTPRTSSTTRCARGSTRSRTPSTARGRFLPQHERGGAPRGVAAPLPERLQERALDIPPRTGGRVRGRGAVRGLGHDRRHRPLASPPPGRRGGRPGARGAGTSAGVELRPLGDPARATDEDETDARVPLPREIAPGETLELDVGWDDKLPRVVERTGYCGSLPHGRPVVPKLARLEPDGTLGALPLPPPGRVLRRLRHLRRHARRPRGVHGRRRRARSSRRAPRAAAASSGTCRRTSTTSPGPRGTRCRRRGDDRRGRVTRALSARLRRRRRARARRASASRSPIPGPLRPLPLRASSRSSTRPRPRARRAGWSTRRSSRRAAPGTAPRGLAPLETRDGPRARSPVLLRPGRDERGRVAVPRRRAQPVRGADGMGRWRGAVGGLPRWA